MAHNSLQPRVYIFREIEELIGPSVNKRAETNGLAIEIAPGSAKGSDVGIAPVAP